MNQTIAEITNTSRNLWKGWAERNAGNISVNITGLLSVREKEYSAKLRFVLYLLPILLNGSTLMLPPPAAGCGISQKPMGSSVYLKMDKTGPISNCGRKKHGNRHPNFPPPGCSQHAGQDEISCKALVHTHAPNLSLLRKSGSSARQKR